MGLRKDIWKVFLVKKSLQEIMTSGFLPDMALDITGDLKFYTFLADPFGLKKDNIFYVFAEYYDYRTRKGIIECLPFDENITLLERKTVLSEPWHLSYPYVFKHGDCFYLLPEASKNNRLTLYQADIFPDKWKKLCDIDLGGDIAVDATPFFHNGLWWLFYMLATKSPDRQHELHVAYASCLTGPWTRHKQNPIQKGAASSRPGGTPITLPNGSIILPVQDCLTTYGRGIRPLIFDALTPDHIYCAPGSLLKIPTSLAPYIEGLHTLSSIGDMTLIDVKKTDLSAKGIILQILRERK
ncbi:glucosamine inositolphosphorylceramide transferase family protein [Acetobacter indonesiensis]|uniref:glucosamine inositolphosphorylceramide transferase family protein n=1 Tax=Acetobacter indonesiensis TaxID=104101 RepID=UPI0020A4CAAC|nr:hypothetical protein [Acetobacter indonesiensis]MCP1231440.1 hypothetical protein [Acetobacter indonesiensis]